jgi:hypothetical protein
MLSVKASRWRLACWHLLALRAREISGRNTFPRGTMNSKAFVAKAIGSPGGCW